MAWTGYRKKQSTPFRKRRGGLHHENYSCFFPLPPGEGRDGVYQFVKFIKFLKNSEFRMLNVRICRSVAPFSPNSHVIYGVDRIKKETIYSFPEASRWSPSCRFPEIKPEFIRESFYLSLLQLPQAEQELQEEPKPSDSLSMGLAVSSQSSL